MKDTAVAILSVACAVLGLAIALGVVGPTLDARAEVHASR